MSTQHYLKLAAGSTADLNAKYIDSKVVGGVQVDVVIPDPTLRSDLTTEVARLDARIDEESSTRLNFDVEIKCTVDEMEDRIGALECIHAGKKLWTCLEEEICSRYNADVDLRNRVDTLDVSLQRTDATIGCLEEYSGTWKCSVVCALNETLINMENADVANNAKIEAETARAIGCEGELLSKHESNVGCIEGLCSRLDDLTECKDVISTEIGDLSALNPNIHCSDLVSSINKLDNCIGNLKCTGMTLPVGCTPSVSELIKKVNDNISLVNDQLDQRITNECNRAIRIEGCVCGLCLRNPLDTSIPTTSQCSLADAINTVHTQLSAVADSYDQIVGDITDLNPTIYAENLVLSLNKEVTRACRAETLLSTDITNESSRAQNCELELCAAIDREIQRATSGEQTLAANLNSAIATQVSNLTLLINCQDACLLGKINAECTRATAKENELRAAVDGIHVEYVPLNKEIVLRDVNGNQLGESIDATVFIKDGLFTEAYYESDPTSDDYGKLVIKFKSTSGDTQVVKIPVSDLIDTYTAGDGLSLDHNRFSVNDSIARSSDLTAEVSRAQGCESILESCISGLNDELFHLTSNKDCIGSIRNLIEAECSERIASDLALCSRLNILECSNAIDGSIKKSIACAVGLEEVARNAAIEVECNRAIGVESELRSDLSDLTTAVCSDETRIAGHTGALEILTEKLDCTCERVDNLTSCAGNIEGRLSLAETGLSNVSTCVQADEVRLNAVCSKVDVIDGKLTTDEATLVTHGACIGELKTAIDSIDVSTQIDNKLNPVISRVSTNESSISELRVIDAELCTKINNLSSDLDETAQALQNEINSKISSVFKWKGNVTSYADLPATDNTVGDVWTVLTAGDYSGVHVNAGDNFSWTSDATGGHWQKLAGMFDTSSFLNTLTGGVVNGSIEVVTDTPTGYIKVSDRSAGDVGSSAKVGSESIELIDCIGGVLSIKTEGIHFESVTHEDIVDLTFGTPDAVSKRGTDIVSYAELSAEVTRATTCEGELDTKIDNEISRASAAECILRDDLCSEISRACSAECILNDKINAEVDRACVAEAALGARIDALDYECSAESFKYIGGITQVDGKIEVTKHDLDIASVDGLTDKLSCIEEAIACECERADTEENRLCRLIDAEVDRACSAELALISCIEDLDYTCNTESYKYISGIVQTDGAITVTKQDLCVATVCGLSSRLSEIDHNILSECTRADTEEQRLCGLIDSEVVRACTEENRLCALIESEVDRADTEEKRLCGLIDTADGKLSTLIGSDSSKSVRTIANEELAAQLIPETAQESLDTLQEIAAWIQAHPDEASTMNSCILDNTCALEKLNEDSNCTGSVDNKIASVIESLDYTDTAESGKFLTSVNEADGIISVTRSGITNTDLPNGIDPSKIKSILDDPENNSTLIYDIDTLNDAIGTINGDENTNGSIECALKSAKDYADSLASNYDIVGSAASALSDAIGTSSDAASANTINGAKKYADSLISISNGSEVHTGCSSSIPYRLVEFGGSGSGYGLKIFNDGFISVIVPDSAS